MYSESSGSRKTLGDVDVLFHDGIYHLFHLVLPNHDFIAHAVSNDCFSWRRVENALHIGDPGSFDDSMLWTTQVTPHPHRKGWWRMFYTGLSRRDHGMLQRIGMAESDNLYCWEKSPVHWEDRRSELPYDLPGRPPQPPFEFDASSCFPLEPDAEFYESQCDDGRHWISWRDPFYYRDDNGGRLLIAGRVKHGPVVRRGCVAQFEEVGENCFEARSPLFHPGLYDDIEVPNLLKIEDRYLLIGSLREDAKVRYWYSDSLDSNWQSASDNVLLPSGNYAGRICDDENGWLLFSFFTPNNLERTVFNVMPPPKRLTFDTEGRLVVRSFEGFDQKVVEDIEIEEARALRLADGAVCTIKKGNFIDVSNRHGFEIFELVKDVPAFRFRVTLELRSEGKCGMTFRLDPETQDGYYLSLDLVKGVAQARAWGSGPEGSGENMMRFESLQSGYWRTSQRGTAEVQLIAYGSYVELSVNDRVVLSFADQSFVDGSLGLYVDSAELHVSDYSVERLSSPVQSDEHLANG